MNPSTDMLDLPPDSIVLPRVRADASPQGRHRPKWADFVELTKPRLNGMVVVTTLIGYAVAGRGTGWTMLHATLATAMTAGGSAVLNQWIERENDRLMPRTRHRPLPAGRVSPMEALVFGIALCVLGLAYLFTCVNAITGLLGAATVLSYLFIYTPLKQRSTLNTLVGAVPGAIPPLMGWTAATGSINASGLALFAILFVWQLPHFMAIAMMYRDDYRLGGFKMTPCVDDDRFSRTVRTILIFNGLMIPAAMSPCYTGLCGIWYGGAATLLSVGYLAFGIAVARTRARREARRLFFASIIYLPVLLTIMMLDRR